MKLIEDATRELATAIAKLETQPEPASQFIISFIKSARSSLEDQQILLPDAIRDAVNSLCTTLAFMGSSRPSLSPRQLSECSPNIPYGNEAREYLWCGVGEMTHIDPSLSSAQVDVHLASISNIKKGIDNICAKVIPVEPSNVTSDTVILIHQSLKILRSATENITSLRPFLSSEAIQIRVKRVVFIHKAQWELRKALQGREECHLRPFLSQEAVNASLVDEHSPLHLSAERRDPKVMELFLRAGARVNTKDSFLGWTTLHYAVHRRNEALVRLLIDWKADVNSRTSSGTTPLQLCQDMANIGQDARRCVELLTEAIMSSLVSKINNEEIYSTCSICLKAFTKESVIIQPLKCEHWYHKRCFSRWLENSQTCPDCRRDI